MAEPTGWSWVGTQIRGNQVVIYDRGLDYGEYKYNPFSKSFVKTNGTEYNPTSSPNTWRFIIATDFSIENIGVVGSEELQEEGEDELGRFPARNLPWSFDTRAFATSEEIGSGYENTKLILGTPPERKCILSLVQYWKNTNNESWFLPSINELNLVNTARGYLGGLARDLSQNDLSDSEDQHYIWSSSCGTENQAMVLIWETGGNAYAERSSELPRAVLCRYE